MQEDVERKREHVEIEARWPQKIGEGKAGGIRVSKTSKQDAGKELLRREEEVEILNPNCDARKKLWRDEAGKL